MQQYPMTKIGAELLREELQRLKHVERPKITQAIAQARALGDLKENAEYHSAREQQSFIEGKIKDIEAKLSLAQIIDIRKIPNQGKVIFGSTVSLINRSTQKKIVYQIVGHDEANISLGKISIDSPIVRAMIGKQEGDIATIDMPKEKIVYEILSVEYK